MLYLSKYALLVKLFHSPKRTDSDRHYKSNTYILTFLKGGWEESRTCNCIISLYNRFTQVCVAGLNNKKKHTNGCLHFAFITVDGCNRSLQCKSCGDNNSRCLKTTWNPIPWHVALTSIDTINQIHRAAVHCNFFLKEGTTYRITVVLFTCANSLPSTVVNWFLLCLFFSLFLNNQRCLKTMSETWTRYRTTRFYHVTRAGCWKHDWNITTRHDTYMYSVPLGL